MKSLTQYINESIPISVYRQFLKDQDEVFTNRKAIKDKPTVDAYKSAFWKVLSELPDAELSRNKHRIYLPFNRPTQLAQNIVQMTQYMGDQMPVEVAIRNYITNDLGKEIENWQYRDGNCTIGMDTQQGKKYREMKIGKLIAKRKDLLDAFAADPFRLTKNIEDADKLIVISDHPYDLAGMSTGRKWTSCMNIINGCNKEYVAVDMQYGTLIAYLILKEDKNIESPLGRLLIKPYELTRKDYVGFERRPVVYSPDPTVYSTYVGLDGMVEYLNEICKETQPYQGTLKKKQQLYYDDFFQKKDLKFNI